VGGGQDPHAAARRPGIARQKLAEAPLLHGAELAHVLEQQAAAALLRPLGAGGDGAVEGLAGERARARRGQLAAGAGARQVDAPGHELAAAAGLALDENRLVALRERLDAIDDGAHGAGLGHEERARLFGRCHPCSYAAARPLRTTWSSKYSVTM